MPLLEAVRVRRVHPIEGLIAHDPNHPSHRRTLRLVITDGVAPDGNKALLQHLFGPVAPPQDAQRHTEKSRRRLPVEASERLLVAARAGGNEVRQRLGRLPGGTNR